MIESTSYLLYVKYRYVIWSGLIHPTRWRNGLGRRFVFSVVKTVVGRGSGWGLVVWVIPTTWSWTLCTRMRPGSSLRIPIPYLKPCSSSSIQKAKRSGWWLLVQSSPRPWHPYQRSSLDARKVGETHFFFFMDQATATLSRKNARNRVCV